MVLGSFHSPKILTELAEHRQWWEYEGWEWNYAPETAEQIHEFAPGVVLTQQPQHTPSHSTLYFTIDGSPIMWLSSTDYSKDPLFPHSEHQAELAELDKKVGLRSFDIASLFGLGATHSQAIGLTMGSQEIRDRSYVLDHPHYFITSEDFTGKHHIEAKFQYTHGIEVIYTRTNRTAELRHIGISIDGHLALASCMHPIWRNG